MVENASSRDFNRLVTKEEGTQKKAKKTKKKKAATKKEDENIFKKEEERLDNLLSNMVDKPRLDFGSLLGSSDMLRLDLKREMEILRSESKQIPPTMIEVEEAKHEHLVVVTTEERNKKHSSAKSETELLRLRALVTIPYLPPNLYGTRNYTLVLDLDETLIHLECDDDDEDEPIAAHDDDVYYLIRPGAIKFLNEMAKYFEIVIFTAAMPDVSVVLTA